MAYDEVHRHAERNVSVEWVVSARLICYHVDVNAAGDTAPINRALNGHYTAEEARGGRPNSTASRAEREAIEREAAAEAASKAVLDDLTIRVEGGFAEVNGVGLVVLAEQVG